VIYSVVGLNLSNYSQLEHNLTIPNLISTVCTDPMFENKLYDQVYGQFVNIIYVLIAVCVYMLVLNLLVKFKKLDYEQFNRYNYYGFVGLLCIVGMLCGMFAVVYW